MTECTTDGIGFSGQGRRRVEADFNGGAITSDAGALLLREADRRLGLTTALAACLSDPRDPTRITHEQVTMLRQRVFGLALGYEDLNDHSTLRDDPVFKLLGGAADGDDALASAPTLCRLENRADRVSMWRMAAALVDTLIASHGSNVPEQLVLDFDATDDPLHGKQEGRFFHGYYDQYCFLPLYVFCGDKLLGAYLRPSNIDGAKHSWAILALLVKRLRSVWPKVRIIVRADAGFCRWRMLRWCERRGVHYLIGLARNSRLAEMAGPWMDKAAAGFALDPTPKREFGEVEYARGHLGHQAARDSQGRAPAGQG